MKVKEKLKAYIVGLIREESEELAKRQKLLEENVRDLNAQMEGQEAIAENVRNLNAQMESRFLDRPAPDELMRWWAERLS